MLASTLADVLQARLLGDDVDISAVRRIDRAGPSDLSLLLTPTDRRRARQTRAACLLLSTQDAAECADELPSSLLVHDEPFVALQKVIDILHPKPRDADVQIYPTSHVGNARIGSGTRIMPFVYIDDDVEIGQDCVISPGCVIMSGVRLGNRVILQPGVVLGADAFVYAQHGETLHKLRCVAGVHIGDDVEIGAGSCVDRGLLEHTVIESGSKIDNLVQVGHDVSLGQNTVMVAQSGIGGHSSLGANVSIGGQAGVGPHRRIEQGAQISAAAALFCDVAQGEVYSGSPAQPHMDYLRMAAAQKALSGMQKELRSLRSEVEGLKLSLSGPRVIK